ncbi:MAG: pilus assembly protein PilM [Candidatus Omnitrophica bacterium]|nr:pilus assembly protein PilM [Candidatus Omnitrophota bacterium]
MTPLPFAQAARSGWQLLTRLTSAISHEPKFTIGVDIGSSAVKTVALGSRKASGTPPLLGHHHVALNNASDTEISAAIKAAVSALSVPARTVTCSVSGPAVILRVVEMPAMNPDELVQALPIEAQRHLPFNVKDVVLDGAILGPAEEHKIWVLIVACKREHVAHRMQLVQQAGLAVGCLDVDALALTNALLQHANGRTPTAPRAIINVGAEQTNLVVLRADTPDLIRDIPWGAAKLMHHVAEHVGRSAAEVAAQLEHPAPLSPELQAALTAACESITADLQLSFDFFENRFGVSPNQVLVSGGLSHCAGFLEGLRGHLTQPISAWSPVSELSGAYTIAYGLALRT